MLYDLVGKMVPWILPAVLLLCLYVHTGTDKKVAEKRNSVKANKQQKQNNQTGDGAGEVEDKIIESSR